MSLTIFDLDNTLIGGDSDYLWGQFLVELGIVDQAHYESTNQRFYDDYKDGKLDIAAFLNFSLEPLAQYDTDQLFSWREQFMVEKIDPIMLPAAEDLIEKHRQKGDTLLVITATNRFITELIVEKLGINELLATEPEKVDGRYTGRFTDIPCYQHGKVERLERWLETTAHDLTDSFFYSDSFNDLPLLKLVTNPVAVDPDETLRKEACTNNWPIITLRDN